MGVALYMSAWIEINRLYPVEAFGPHVALYMSAWIEITLTANLSDLLTVSHST